MSELGIAPAGTEHPCQSAQPEYQKGIAKAMPFLYFVLLWRDQPT